MYQLFTFVRSPATAFRLSGALLAASCLGGLAHADINVPTGSSVHLHGASTQLGCSDVQANGTLTLGAGGAVTGARNVQIGSGGTLDVSGASLTLAQQFTNNGAVLAQGGSVTRVDSAGCVAVGQLGPVAVDGGGSTKPPSNTAPVPTLEGGALMALTALLGGLGSRLARRRRQPRSR